MRTPDSPNTDDVICLDKEFSTTRIVTRQEPVIENKPGDKFESMLFLPEGQGRKGEGGLRTKGYFKTSHNQKPLITLITVVLNCEKHLEEAIQSIITQTYDNVEYIIIDGGSTDGTLDIIKKHEDKIDYWISEKDDGLYDAMNKGISLATGVIIGLVNADDCLYPSTLEAIADLAANNPEMTFTFGEVDLMCPKGTIFGRSIPLSKDLVMKRLYREMPYQHLSIFIARYIYKQLGLFDPRFKINADYDFLLRMIGAGLYGCRIPAVVGAHRFGGISGGSINTQVERRWMLKKHGVPAWKRNLYFADALLKAASYQVLPRSLINFLRKFRTSINTYY